MKTVHNERKDHRDLSQRSAIAIFAIGGFTPAVQMVRVATAPPEMLGGTILVVIICTSVAGAPHLAARGLLGGLVE
jgi:hypothetical protein